MIKIVKKKQIISCIFKPFFINNRRSTKVRLLKMLTLENKSFLQNSPSIFTKPQKGPCILSFYYNTP